MSCKTLRVAHTQPYLSCVITTLNEHTDAAYKTYIQFLRVIKYSLRTRFMFVKGIKYIYISQKEHYIEDLAERWFSTTLSTTTVGNLGDKGQCVAVVLWLGVQSWQQSFYMGCVGLQTLSWPLFFATRRIDTWRAVAVTQAYTRGRQERQWGGCAKALGSSMWCIRC